MGNEPGWTGVSWYLTNNITANPWLESGSDVSHGQFGYRTGRNEAQPTKNWLVLSWIFKVQPVFGGIIPICGDGLKPATDQRRKYEKIVRESANWSRAFQLCTLHVSTQADLDVDYHHWIRILHWLVVWNMNFIFPYIGNVIIPTDFHIFQRGRYTTNQIITGWWPETTPTAVKSQDGPQSSSRSVAEEEVAKKQWFLWFMADLDITIVNGVYKPSYNWRAPSNGWCQPMRFGASNPTFDA